MTTAQRRPDIDGLRALAIGVVLMLHLGFTGFDGGFIGVDIFYVISGFLITRLIKAEVESGSFSFGRFYVRRMRRLFPALAFTLALTTLGAALLLSPEHLKEYGGSLLFAAVSLSNVFFWSQAGYFDVSSIFKPLLHTWSLSVEEQFYLFWPLLTLWSLTAFQRLPLLVLLVVGALSLIANVLVQLIAVDFRQAPATIFYLTPFRVFEFVIGAAVVWLENRLPRNRLWLEPLLLVGLALILVPVATYDAATIFPSLNALPPCVGAAMVIYAGQAKYAGLLLRNPLAVGIGLISYSLYLVHWPIIVFWNYIKFAPPTFPEQMTMRTVVECGSVGERRASRLPEARHLRCEQPASWPCEATDANRSPEWNWRCASGCAGSQRRVQGRLAAPALRRFRLEARACTEHPAAPVSAQSLVL